MPTVNITVKNTVYPIACDAGEEETLHFLAEMLDGRLKKLAGGFAQGSDVRLLVIAALMMESEIRELKEKLAQDSAETLVSELDSLSQRIVKAASFLRTQE